jgi:hypothetical protein
MAPRASECHVAGRARPSDEIRRLGNVDSFFFHVRVHETDSDCQSLEALVVVRLPTDADIRALVSRDSRDYYSASSARFNPHFNTR